ncbi:MAG TPA: hypothetical protein VG817_11135, partial [Gemmatimonadales bacterium]|nr:hypothetical protein [Gemmatimonadales bacterium]
ALLKKLVKEHKQVIFNGDGYSQEWHKEAEKRGLPHLRDSVDALSILKSKTNTDLFKKYGVLNKAEYESRIHIQYEKYVKQLTIEAETMAVIGRTQILPAAIEHQGRTAAAIASTEAAGVKDKDSLEALGEYVNLVSRFREALEQLEKVVAHHDDDPVKHAQWIRDKVKPAMAEVRTYADTLETHVAAELWPLPTYRELLFLK